jgi:hypothetical protein
MIVLELKIQDGYKGLKHGRLSPIKGQAGAYFKVLQKNLRKREKRGRGGGEARKEKKNKIRITHPTNTMLFTANSVCLVCLVC